MKSPKISEMIGSINLSITDAMKKIDNNAKGTLFITDASDKLVGAISDGDIRRWLIETGDLDAEVIEFMNKSPIYIKNDEMNRTIELFSTYLVHAIPIVDDEMRIIDIIFDNDISDIKINNLKKRDLSDIPVIIMAGGMGKRLYPYTKILPKPLIPINDIPIVERIIKEFEEYGTNAVYMTLNYKKEMIKAYFSETKYVNILRYVEEDKPLGTAGSINLFRDELSGDVIVTNCDILVKADYCDILDYHKNNNNDITVVSALVESTIPYGVIHSGEEGLITSIDEKPQIPYVVNTGMYVVKAECFKDIPSGEIYHMTDLIKDLLMKNKRVGMYPISNESFLDMGEFVEMQRMEEKLKGSL